MGITKGVRFGREDIYVDYPFEEVMFRWDHTERKIYRQFYGKVESGPVPHDNRLYNDALLYGEETTKDKYLNGKRRSAHVTKFMLRSSIAPRILTLCASIALYIGSLYLPAMYFEKEPPLYGMSVLAQGWFGLLTLNPSWLANPLYVATIVQFVRRRYSSSRLLSLIAVGCALCSLWTSEWDFNEAYGTPIKHLGAAFYMWFIALLVLLSGSEYLRRSGTGVPEAR
jgi:hypothetical protein